MQQHLKKKQPNQLVEFYETNKIFSEKQFGFKNKFTTTNNK